MSKITVLGGVGSQAISTTIDLSRTSKFDEIVLADGNMDKARELASLLKDDNRVGEIPGDET